MSAGCVMLYLALCVLCPTSSADDATRLTRVTLASPDGSTLEGRVILQAQDGGLLLEDGSGRLHTIKPDQMVAHLQLDEPFEYDNSAELATKLADEFGGRFEIRDTSHYVICSDASPVYSDYAGRLLEHVHGEFLEFMESCEVDLEPLPAKLPVVIFGSQEAFQDYARRQHPETEFSNVPGFYSVRDNRMLIVGPPPDRSLRTRSDVVRKLRRTPRQVETIVHEAVHQLAFNTGLQVRYADNPLWISEGLATYFEESSGRGRLIWNRPGGVNEIHLAGYKRNVREDALTISLEDLFGTDSAFLKADTSAAAYSEAWALSYYLVRTDRRAYGRLLSGLRDRQPLQTVSPKERIAAVTAATQQSLPELQAGMIRYLGRLRAR